MFRTEPLIIYYLKIQSDWKQRWSCSYLMNTGTDVFPRNMISLEMDSPKCLHRNYDTFALLEIVLTLFKTESCVGVRVCVLVFHRRAIKQKQNKRPSQTSVMFSCLRNVVTDLEFGAAGTSPQRLHNMPAF